ncbi:unnamed protein product [Notodromas monacha]|uniref:Uncharacterized protein n=1 Tax=Notodromas monacha TaxID=399045 RepID=A0A7R9BZJ9_9CRUS|nr:unnamed protein product [Notodromas monacha]CAG0924232.1 unnamed protein product [Notodromas monacha]
MRLSAPVVALAEEVEKLIPVQQLPPPAPPPENVPPNRNLYSMECEVCGPFSKPRKADPGEIHLDPDCQNKSTRRLGLRGSLTKLFEKLSPRKRPQPISTSAEEITPISSTKKTQANIPKPAVDDPRLATLKEPGASARSVPVQEESSSAFSLPEGRSGDKTSRMFEKPLNFRETFQKAENSPRRQKDKILEKAGRDADDIFDRKTENLRLSSKSSSSQQIEETAADRRNRQDMRRQKQNAVDEADNAFTTPAMTSIRDNEVWEGEKEQFNLDSFLDNQMYIDPNKPKATATTNKERREDGATRRMGRTIAKQKDWMPRTSSSWDKN